MSLRIIAGERRGAALATPKGLQTRPTLGRVRGSLFMILMPELPGARVLDCFAGCGALGLEALSRGAAYAVFIEHSRPALEALRANIEKLRWAGRTRIVAREALAWLTQAAPAAEPFDLILLDPPYGRDLCHRAMQRLADRQALWLHPHGVVVAQHGRDDPLQDQYGSLHALRNEAYGETRIAFYRPHGYGGS